MRDHPAGSAILNPDQIRENWVNGGYKGQTERDIHTLLVVVERMGRHIQRLEARHAA